MSKRDLSILNPFPSLLGQALNAIRTRTTISDNPLGIKEIVPMENDSDWGRRGAQYLLGLKNGKTVPVAGKYCEDQQDFYWTGREQDILLIIIRRNDAIGNITNRVAFAIKKTCNDLEFAAKTSAPSIISGNVAFKKLKTPFLRVHTPMLMCH